MSEMVKALGLALGARKYDKPPIALCPNCESPLVGTFLFPKAEFYCLDCGHACGFVAPIEGDPDNKELTDKMSRYEKEWVEHMSEGLTTEAAEWLDKRKK